MDYNEILKEAAGLMGPYCKACPVCNGRACANTMPGPGCKFPGNAAARNYDKWQEIFVNMDTLCPNSEADTSFELFGKKFSAPVFIAPLGALPLHYGDKYDDLTYNDILIRACANAGILAFTGDGTDPKVVEGVLTDDEYAELSQLIADVDFFSMKDSYGFESTPKNGMNDLVYQISLSSGGKEKFISIRSADKQVFPQSFIELVKRITVFNDQKLK